MAIYDGIGMSTKKLILQSINKSSAKKGSFAFRVYKLIKEGNFDGVLSSHDLVHLLDEGPGKKIKVNNLAAQMEPLLREDIVKIKIEGKGRNKRKFWYPGWVEKKDLIGTLAQSGDKILFFTGNDCWTDLNKNFQKIIEALYGNLDIVDRFYGNGTLHVLQRFGKNRKIRFLTCELGKDEQQDIVNFQINLQRFKREFKNIEMKKYDKWYELHDRYVIADNALVIVGHGIKDLADKESFVIFLPREQVKGFLPNLRTIFEKRWKNSIKL